MAVGTTTSVKHNVQTNETEGESQGHHSDDRGQKTEGDPRGYHGESRVQIDSQLSSLNGNDESEASRNKNQEVTESGTNGEDMASRQRTSHDDSEQKEPAIKSATSSTVVCGGGCVAATQRAAAGKCPACECPADGCPCTKCGCPLCGPTQTASTPLPCRGGDAARDRAIAGNCPACGCPTGNCPCTNCICPAC
uniref:Uncharacterized protein n=1 Tax=Peronospora matthiolae TaxID=2874970 RepID=A0AAV1VG72_9STRA